MAYVKGVWVDEVLTEDARYDILDDAGTPIARSGRPYRSFNTRAHSEEQNNGISKY